MLFNLLSVLGVVPTFQKAKCKRLLNITMERIKLLEKRRQARHRQLRRDVIELLQLKKEHKIQPLLMRIWKELCLFYVYIKIADYCGFVQINLKEIAEQRECPYGLKEPVAGLCFAASCCADLPELQELREIFATKYGKQIVDSGEDLQPNCHVDQEFLDYLYAKDPSELRKQALLDDINMKYNTMKGHEQSTQQQEIHYSSSTESLVDACNQSQEGIDYTMKESAHVKDQSESEELQEVDVVQESNHIELVCKADVVSTELANAVANQKRTLEDTETRHSAFKRAYRRMFWMNKAMDGEENGGEKHEQTAVKAHDSRDTHGRGDQVCSNTGRRLASVHPDGYEGYGEGIPTHMNENVARNENLPISIYVEQPPYSRPPQRPPPPPPPPKRAPPPPPSLRVVSMPGSRNHTQANAKTNPPLRCSTMANIHYLETYGSHVHPRLPKYEDLVANFTALKH